MCWGSRVKALARPVRLEYNTIGRRFAGESLSGRPGPSAFVHLTIEKRHQMTGISILKLSEVVS